MELKLIMRALLRRWWLIVLPTIIAAVFALPALLGPAGVTGGYSAVVDYSAAQSPEAFPSVEGDFQDIWLSSELMINAFTDWVRGSEFAAAAAARAAEQLGIDTAAFAGLRFAADNARSVGRIYFNWPDAEQLAALIDGAVDTLREQSHEVFPQLGGVPAQVTILDRSPVNPAPPALPDRLGPFIRIAIGLFIGLALAALAHYLDPVVRQRDDVEALGLPVLAAIPRR
ncbi:MAG: hypothetical protein SNJ59_08895 [Aggregatilineales bacterium]